MSSAAKVVKKAVSTVADPFDMGYGDKIGKAAGKVFTAGQDAKIDEVMGLKQEPIQREGEPEKPTAPIPDEEAQRRARERRYMRRYSMAGRKGTVLSEGHKLG